MNNKTLGIIVGVVVLVIIGWLIYRYSHNGQPAYNAPAYTQSNSQNNTPAANSQPVATTTPTTPAKMSYTDALKKYGSNRIQFDTACQAHPNSASFKAGASVMFDNRSAAARKIVFNGSTYNIAAYDYAVVVMKAPTLPATAYIDCGSSQNVAKIMIE